MKTSLTFFCWLCFVFLANAQTPCDGASGAIVATGYSTTNDGYYQQCVGGSITFNVEDVVLPDAGSADTVQWYIDGHLQQTLTTDSFILSYSISKLVMVTARVISSTGCYYDMALDMPVAFLSVPQPWTDDVLTACVVDDATVVDIEGLITQVEPTVSFEGNGIALDGPVMSTFESEIFVAGVAQQYITECHDLSHLLLNIEHSFATDFDITLECPNGSSVQIMDFPNMYNYFVFGEPVMFDFNLVVPGVGYDYYWSMEAQYGMHEVLNGDTAVNPTMPSGVYLPSESFCALVGCPINGTWKITLTDYYGIDNGFLFHSGLSFNVGNNDLQPYDYSNSQFNTFSWTSDNFIFSNESLTQATVHLVDTTAGYFQYSYTNPAGCTGTTSSLLQMEWLPLSLTLSDDFVYGFNQNNIITAEVINLNSDTAGIYHYWSPASALVNPEALTTQVHPITDDTWITFTVDIPDAIGCALTDSILVSMPDNAVMLTVFHDLNENGVYDEGEIPLPMFPVDCDLLGTVYTSPFGTILTSLDDATSFEINVDAFNWELTTPAVIEVDEEEWTGYAQYYYFGVKPTANTEVNIDVSLSGIHSLCNSNSYGYAILHNSGFYYPGGIMVVTIDMLYTVVSTSIAPVSTADNVFTFAVPELNYHQSHTVLFTLTNPAEDAFGMDTFHRIDGYSITVEGGLSEILDTDTLSEVIICAYDPNDKITHTGTGEEGFIHPNTDMEYTINFQNIGNAPATDVVVIDEITDLLDITSLQPIAWSHDFVLSVVGNTATFRFDDIQLLGVEQDEELSKGFVRFKIKQQPNLAPGTEIENTAEIFFDNNEPIITNTALNTIITPTSIDDINNHQLLVYPNPTSTVIYWNDVQYTLMTVTNAMGQRIEGVSSNRNGQYTTSSLSAGMYILQFENEQGHSIRQSLIIQ